MRILLVVPYPIADPRGNSVAARRLRDGFLRAGHDVVVWDPPFPAEEADGQVTGSDEPSGVAAGSGELVPGGQVEGRGGPAAASLAPSSPLLSPPPGPFSVALLLHAWRCAGASAVLARGGAARGRLVPQVVSLRGTDLNEMLDHPATGPTIRRVLARSAAIVVFHEAARRELVEREPAWAAKVRVIPNGVALPRSQVDYRQRLGLPPGALVVGAIAGLREVKRPLLVLPWLERLRQEGADLIWLHAGAPLEEAVVRRLAEFRIGRPWVRHVDEIPHAEIDSFLRAMDLFVAASRSEGMPHAVREAMLSRRPCLLSDIPGHRALAEPEREALFFTGEEDFLAQARRLLGDPARRRQLGEAARRRVEADLAKDDEVGGFLRLFARLAAHGFEA
ncbi:MAG: glycosyl transferase, group 1 family protein [Candidatus Ozemobacter sibiricus]|uniref:Glycosyl transferase, group 1 family protein n=1 Tax=Candidatus Ozemobacter sibiricus TaxID=2268124 RepID=A0A367ZLI5_9BACT|nr:MAG: glycosyl transferase, group 1 family protein [Candidatus Ozemobacter sibiricus]